MENVKQWIDEFENLSEIERVECVKILYDSRAGKDFLRQVTEFNPSYNDWGSTFGKIILKLKDLGEIPVESLKKINPEEDAAQFENIEWKIWENEIPNKIGEPFVMYFKEDTSSIIMALMEIDNELKLYNCEDSRVVLDWDGKNKIGELTIDKWHYFIAIK